MNQKNSLPCVQYETLLLCSEQHTTAFCTDIDQSCPHPKRASLYDPLQHHAISESSWQITPFKFPDTNSCTFLIHSVLCYVLRPSNPTSIHYTNTSQGPCHKGYNGSRSKALLTFISRGVTHEDLRYTVAPPNVLRLFFSVFVLPFAPCFQTPSTSAHSSP